jgi:hypothetical protein
MITPSIHLYGRPTGAEPHQKDLTQSAGKSWRRTTHRLYGYLSASFELSSDTMATNDIMWLYHSAIGCTVRELTAGMTTWEGLIWDMRLMVGGVQYARTLDAEWTHNKVRAVYSSDIGARTATAWTENTDASDEYGEMQYIDSMGGATAASAAALVARRITEHAWPRSRMTGSVAIGRATGPVTLQVMCLGYYATLNWKYYTANTTAAASTLVGTLLGVAEFVTAGRVETNTLSVRANSAESERQQRIGDLLTGIISQGDASGNVWQGGVYADKRFRYEQAPTAAAYYLQRGRLLTRGMTEPVPTTVEPGFLAKNLDAPMGYPSHGTDSVWDDPAIGYVEQVEYSTAGGLSVQFLGAEAQLAILQAQISAGSAPRGKAG